MDGQADDSIDAAFDFLYAGKADPFLDAVGAGFVEWLEFFYGIFNVLIAEEIEGNVTTV